MEMNILSVDPLIPDVAISARRKGRARSGDVRQFICIGLHRFRLLVECRLGILHLDRHLKENAKLLGEIGAFAERAYLYDPTALVVRSWLQLVLANGRG